MRKIFAFTIILSSILIAHVVCPKPPETENPPKQESNKPAADVDDSEPEDGETDDGDADEDDDGDVDNQEEESSQDDDEAPEESDIDEEEAEPSLPFLTCSVFNDNFACNAMCSVLRSIYGTPITSGICEEAKECECQVLPSATLEDYWNEKFLAKNTLREILRDEELSGKVFEVLKTPFKTAQQTIEDLKPLLSPKQLNSLRIKNKSAQNIISNDGEFDKLAVQKYVASKLKSLEKPSEGFDHKKTVLDVLTNADNKDIVDYIINEIRQSKNKLLNSVIDDYVKEQGIQVQDPAIDLKDQDTIIDFLDTVVINELIKPPPRENAMKLTGLRSRPKKSAAIANKPSNEPASSAESVNNAKKSSVNNDKKSKTVEASPTNSSSKGMQPSPETNTTSNNKSNPPTSKTQVTDDSRWTLEGFDKSVIDKFDKGTKQWERLGFYSISMRKSCKVVWLKWNNKKDRIFVELYVFNNGDIEQKWSFEDGQITITIRKCGNSGSQTEFWIFPSSRLSCTKDAEGKITQKKWRGKEDPQSLGKSKKYIQAWCAHNDYILGKENCAIY